MFRQRLFSEIISFILNETESLDHDKFLDFVQDFSWWQWSFKR